jgi:hypothetical protein
MDAQKACQSSLENLINTLEGPPDFLVVSFTENYPARDLMAYFANVLPQASIHGSTTCRGVMTEDGFHSEEGRALGLFGMIDPDGAFGVGLENMGTSPREAARRAAENALVHSGRDGELPSLFWLNASPGQEQEVIQGIEDVVSSNIIIAGGSSADNHLAGHWWQFSQDRVSQDGCLISALYSSSGVTSNFHSGYSPTERTGIITKAAGRTIFTIDYQPAAEIYNKWTEGIITEAMHGGNILTQTTMNPLGRITGGTGGIPYYRLAHPVTVTPEKGITLFADVTTGEQVTLMSGSRDSLIHRAGRLIAATREMAGNQPEEIAGALITYCAGCMLAIQGEMGNVVFGINHHLGKRPFLGSFTFGEQGCDMGNRNWHGNLMISVVLFQK